MQLNKRDKDFLDFFGTTTHLFAIIVNYARKFRDLFTQPLLLEKFIEGRGLVSPQNDDFTDLVYLLQNTTDEYRKRGTNKIIERSSDTQEVDGELLRVINFTYPEEFIFALTERQDFGWCLGESSPTWNQTQNIVNLIKGYEFTEEIEELSKYPLKGEGNISVVTEDSKKVIRISNYADETGIGMNEIEDDKLLVVHPSIDYEISFRVKVATGTGENIKFGVLALNENKIELDLTSINDGSSTNEFSEAGSKGLIAGRWYWVRGILHNQNTELKGENNLNFLNGKGLKMGNDIKYICPIISVNGTISTQNTFIYDVKIRPLNLPFSQGLLGVKNIILGYLKNAGQLSDTQLELFIKDKLIPYNSTLKIKSLI